ncbi:hypothetical protein TrLO_g14358 [Triparma laevis f. longispina]|uniref:Uncharacterized protein n=1 Tax=Triparma laevis f. longispina TaxID=1714387 RepID=A0A9W6ZLK7_9STRA|nr:hypothetical protein TrLO_g14358 [Triparma laevis f. longispina]
MLRALILLLTFLTISTAYNVPLTRSTFLKRAAGVATVVIGTPSWSFAEEGELAGVYSDPNHPKGYREITTTTSTLKISGSDTSKTSPTWELTGALGDGNNIIIDFSPKNGPKNLPGKFVGDGIIFPDGNKWPKLS